jgi:hypothetical protein
MKAKKVKLGSRVYVEWVDSWTPNPGWRDYDNEYNLLTVRTDGVIINSNPDCIAVTTSVAEHYANAPIVIPWCAITKFEQFENLITITEDNTNNETD